MRNRQATVITVTGPAMASCRSGDQADRASLMMASTNKLYWLDTTFNIAVVLISLPLLRKLVKTSPNTRVPSNCGPP